MKSKVQTDFLPFLKIPKASASKVLERMRVTRKWYFVSKIVLNYSIEKIVLSSDREKLLKFETEGQ